MDGRGRVQDNIFIERLLWTVKYHYLYLHAFDNGTQLRNGLNEWFKHYNQKRSHQALDNLTPDEVTTFLIHLRRLPDASSFNLLIELNFMLRMFIKWGPGPYRGTGCGKIVRLDLCRGAG